MNINKNSKATLKWFYYFLKEFVLCWLNKVKYIFKGKYNGFFRKL
jgi:hypothetical protein